MKKYRILLTVISLLLVAALLPGCKFGAKQQDAGDIEKATGLLASEKPITLTVHLHYWDRIAYNGDLDLSKRAAELTNVTLKGTASASSTDSNTAFTLALSSKPLPDIIHGTRANLTKAVLEGALIPLDDLIERRAPDIKRYFELYPSVKRATASVDGKHYYIANFREPGPAMGFFIREDWLNKLNLEVPTTVDEYYNVLKAFRERDPNGNGQKDEIPYLYRDKGVDGLLQLWGVGGGYSVFVEGNDGKLVYNRTSPEYKNAMINLAKWYKEGLIDPEIFTRGQKARDILFADNTGGSTHDWFSSTASFNKTIGQPTKGANGEDIPAKVAGFSIIAIPPPADVYGEIKETYARNTLTQGWGISKDNKFPEQTMKYFNFWFTDTGRRLNEFGIEGVDHEVVNGKPTHKEHVKNAPESGPVYMQNRGILEIGTFTSMDGELDMMSKEALVGFKMYVDNKYAAQEFPVLTFTSEEQEIINQYNTSIDTYMREMLQSWLMGAKDINATWDEYVNMLDTMGLPKLLGVQQAAYERYMSVK